ncbi:hypothetical protein DDB_G0279581 [Dictyostelium discoideum AX4]|uniref:Uncharacterized protein n=1 Tax=Dictyostelium discoideum TaxID=44689 RepID=Q54WK6_DICDI|nr:hypothetical protein DDB_G0279581 [Dictyostelium discoideum AX4]EAL67729.1 hypothetical protein DDB_G0279581 [Dictyostelium discoideum AX4]|eukprot:XP_641711.1 hypothetical protein DDB_G0279581 [Dictyostelium discoideum AX4]
MVSFTEYISNDEKQYKTKDLSIFDKQPVGCGLGENELDIETKLNENNIPTHLYVLYEAKMKIFEHALPPLGERSGSIISYPICCEKSSTSNFGIEKF